MRLLSVIAAGLLAAGLGLSAPAQDSAPAPEKTAPAAFKPLTYPIDPAAFEKNLSQQEREIYQLIEDLVAVRSKRTLGCDDATMNTLWEKTGGPSKQLTMLKWQRSGLREHLRWCLEFGKTETGLKLSLDHLLNYEEQIAGVLAEMVHKSQPILGTAKAAQLYLFVDDFERFLATRVAHAAKATPESTATHSGVSEPKPGPTASEPMDFDAFQNMLQEQNRDVQFGSLGNDDVIKLVDALLVVRLAQALDINKEQSVKLFAHAGKAKDQLHELKWQIGRNRSMLRDAIAAKAPDAEIQKQLDDLLIQEKAVAKLVREFVQGAGQDITTAQSAKLYLFLGDFEAYIVGLLERAQI